MILELVKTGRRRDGRRVGKARFHEAAEAAAAGRSQRRKRDRALKLLNALELPPRYTKTHHGRTHLECVL